MVVVPQATDHRGMTTEQPTAPRLLRRRGDDRVLGGVASGLADYFNVDPLLIRIGFVGLMVFNGLGLGLYLLAWLLVPADTDNQSVVQRIIGGRGSGRGIAIVVLIAVALIVLVNVPASTSVYPGGVELSSGRLEFILIVLAVIVIGYLLFRRPESNATVATAVDTDTATIDAPPVAAPPPRSWSAAHRVRRRRSAGTSSARSSSASVCWRWRPSSPARRSISSGTSAWR
jgi:phage shock protein PspC (stress-responsive transcriptional regulator)